MALDPKTIAAVAADYADRHPRDILTLAIREYEGDLAISFSGAEDVVLVDMAAKIGGKFRVFSLDTGRLHPETYQFLDTVRGHYVNEVPVDVTDPAAIYGPAKAERLRALKRAWDPDNVFRLNKNIAP